MTIQKLASAIAKAEGKKHQASIGDVREIIGIIADMLYGDLVRPRGGLPTYKALVEAGAKRAPRAQRKK